MNTQPGENSDNSFPRKTRKKRIRRGGGRRKSSPTASPLNVSTKTDAPSALTKRPTVVSSSDSDIRKHVSNRGSPTSSEPKRMSDFLLELREINDGWLAGIPANFQSTILNTLRELMEDSTSSQAVQTRSAMALVKIFKELSESTKLQAALTVKSQELNEPMEVVEKVEDTRLKVVEKVEDTHLKVVEKVEDTRLMCLRLAALALISGRDPHRDSREEFLVLRDLLARKGLVSPRKKRPSDEPFDDDDG